jgi:hypothetical protein
VAVSRTDAAVPAFASTEGPHAAQDTLASFASGWQLDDDLESRLAEVAFVDDEIIEAEIVDVSGREAECAEILYIE